MSRTRGPIVIDPSDLRPADLGGGYQLVFQRSIKYPTKVRAVVKAADRSIYAAGDMVEESNALVSRLSALGRSRDRTYNASLGLRADASPEDQKQALLRQIEAMAFRPKRGGTRTCPSCNPSNPTHQAGCPRCRGTGKV